MKGYSSSSFRRLEKETMENLTQCFGCKFWQLGKETLVAPPFQEDSKLDLPGSLPPAPLDLEVCPRVLLISAEAIILFWKHPAPSTKSHTCVGLHLSPSSAQRVKQTQGSQGLSLVHFALCPSLDPWGGDRGHLVSSPASLPTIPLPLSLWENNQFWGSADPITFRELD